MNKRTYYVYILTNQDLTVLHTRVTNNLERRIHEYRTGKGGQFNKKYKLHDLVHLEEGDDIEKAILREKQIKVGSRKDKINLIKRINPEWKDLFVEYFREKCVDQILGM